MSHSTQFPVLFMLPSDNEGNIAIDKSDASFHPNDKIPSYKQAMSPWHNSPLITGQLLEESNASSDTSSLQSIDQLELRTWTVLPDGGSVTSPGLPDESSDIDNTPRKKDNKSTSVDGGSRLPRLQNFATPAALPVDARLAVENKVEPSLTTPISSYTQIDKIPIPISLRKRTNGLSNPLVPRPLTMSKSTSTSNSVNSKDRGEPPRKRATLRPTSSSYGAKLKKSQGRKADQDELERWTNANVAHVRFRKPDELRLLEEVEEENVKRNVRPILTCLMEMDINSSNENVPRNEETLSKNRAAIAASSIYTHCDDLVEEIFGLDGRNRGIKPKTGLVKQRSLEKSRASSKTDLPIVTRSEVAIPNIQQDDEKEIITSHDPSDNHSCILKFPGMGVSQTVYSPAPDMMVSREIPSRTSVSVDECQMDFSDMITKGISHSGEHQLFRRTKDPSPEDKTVLGKRTREGIIIEEKRKDITVMVGGDDAEVVPEDDKTEVHQLDMDELLETSSKGPEWTKIVETLDEPGVAITSDIEREQVKNTLEYPSIDNNEDQEDEEMRQDVDSPQVPLPQLEDWSATLRALIKGKKKFQHQDLIELKKVFEEIFKNRANIPATSSLAQEVYQVSQLEVHDVPNNDDLGLRALARKSTRYWGIKRKMDV